ncbi:peptidase, partial [Vibrio sp. 1069]|nr:peptidase [Vibrio sp. 1069]
MDLGSKYQRKLAVGLVLVSPLLVSPSLSAAQLERLEPNHGRVVSLEKQNLAATQNVAKALGLKPGNNVQKLKANQDKNGDVHVRYQQTYKGIPIWGKQIVLHRDKQGKIKRFGGTLVHDIGQDISNTTPQLNLERIRSKVQKPYLDVGYHI